MPEQIRIFVKSERVPGWVSKVKVYDSYVGVGPPLTREESRIIYHYLLDEYQQRLVYEAEQLAKRLNIEIRVIDISQAGTLSRVLFRVVSALNKKNGMVFSA